MPFMQLLPFIPFMHLPQLHPHWAGCLRLAGSARTVFPAHLIKLISLIRRNGGLRLGHPACSARRVPWRPPRRLSPSRSPIPCAQHGPTRRSSGIGRPAPGVRQASGLSLIEILVALCITATLAALAWPRFEGVLHRARRSEAQTALAEVLNAQSRYRSTHPRYAGSLAELGLAASPLEHYQLRLLDLPKSGSAPESAPFQHGFVALASPLRTSPQLHDLPCAELRLTLEGRQVTHSASDAAGRPSPPCWPR